MRKFICIIITFIITFSSIIVFAKDELKDNNLKDKKQEIEKQINEKQEEISKLKLDMTENLEQIQKLDEKIKQAQENLEESSNKANILNKTVIELEKTLKEEKEKYEKQQKLLEERIIAIYEAGETKYLDVILNSRNLSEFLSSYYVISEIAESDKELLEIIADKKDNIENTTKRLKKEKEEMVLILQKQTRTSNILKTTKSIRENYINQLSEKEKQAQEKLDEYNKVLVEVNNQILDLAKQGINSSYIGGELAWPVPGYTRISSPYGMRVHPITHIYKLHTGVDISAPIGANFVAANDGIVTKAEYNIAYGNMVIIDHGGGISTLYAHGSKILVEVGQTVKRNESILKVGSTGYSTGAHAHFEVRKNGKVVNPMPYITSKIVPNSEEDKKQEQVQKENEDKKQEENKEN